MAKRPTRKSRSGVANKPDEAALDSSPSRRAIVAVLAGFCVLFVASEIFSYTRLSATFDEPGHLAAGYAALTASDYRLDIEHPPLIRMWTALPLLGTRVNPGAFAAMNGMTPVALAFNGPFAIAHQFLYGDNDADRLLYRARFMTVLLGAFLGVLVFWWTFEWIGWHAALIALVLYLTEPNIAAHSELVTNDLAVACFIFGSMFFAWRALRRWSWPDAAACIAFAAAAPLTKFSGLVAPVLVLVMLSAGVIRHRLKAVNVAVLTACLCAALFAGAWTLYGFRFAPSPNANWIFNLDTSPAARAALPLTSRLAGWINTHRLLPNALVEGFVHSQALASSRPAFLFGQYSISGWWYYFPVAIAVKTPTILLALIAIALVSLSRRRVLLRLGPDGAASLIVPAVVFLAAAMAASLNIGLRHVLPVYPFMIVLGAAGARVLLGRRPQRFVPVLVLVAACGLFEFASSYPDELAFFNVAAGGPSNGYRYLADSNIDWGQALKPLDAWMKRTGVKRVNLVYFGTADPKYYGMNVRHVSGTISPGVAPAELGPPELPGYIAISTTLLDGVPFPPELRDFYAPLRDRTPTADIDGAIKVYWVQNPWW